MIGEVVEHLLDAHGVLGRQHVLAEKPADVGVAGGVDVDRERRERLAGGSTERIVDDLVVSLGVRLGRAWRHPPISPVRFRSRALARAAGRTIGSCSRWVHSRT